MQYKKVTKPPSDTLTHKFEVGKRVTVIEPGHTYPSFSTMFEKHNFKNTAENPAFPRGTNAYITAVDVHPNPITGLSGGDVIIYALVVNIDGKVKECIIGETGLVTEITHITHTSDVKFVRVYPDLSLCHWDAKSNVLAINGETLITSSANVHDLRLHEGCKGDVIIRIHNEATGGYGDFRHIGSARYYAQFMGLGIDTHMRFYWDQKMFTHDMRKIVI